MEAWMATVSVSDPEVHDPAVWAETSLTADFLFKRLKPPMLPKTKTLAPAPTIFKNSRRVTVTVITSALDIKEVPNVYASSGA
jgi:hypothetical protein